MTLPSSVRRGFVSGRAAWRRRRPGGKEEGGLGAQLAPSCRLEAVAQLQAVVVGDATGTALAS